MMIELKLDIRAAGIGILVRGRNRSFTTGPGDCDALVPLRLLARAAVDLEHNALVVDDDVANAGLVTRFNGGAKRRQHRLQRLAAWRNYTVAQAETLLPHGKRCANINEFRVER